MANLEEKNKVKKVLEALNINPNINFAYFLNAIDENKGNIEAIRSELRRIEYNQQQLDLKLDRIIRLISGR